MLTQRCLAIAGGVLAAVAFAPAGATAQDAPPNPPTNPAVSQYVEPTPTDPAVSQYIEQIPTASGSSPSRTARKRPAAPSSQPRRAATPPSRETKPAKPSTTAAPRVAPQPAPQKPVARVKPRTTAIPKPQAKPQSRAKATSKPAAPMTTAAAPEQEAVAAQQSPNPVRVAVASTADDGRLGRGAVLALVLGAVTLLALGGLGWQHGFRR